MKKILIRILISTFFGIILGVITECALIFNWKTISLITQTIGFWIIVVLLGTLFSKDYKSAMLTNILLLDFMSLSYYFVRFIYSSHINWYSIQWYIVQGTIGAIIISIMLKLPKKGKYISVFFYLCLIFYFIYYYIINRTLQGAWTADRNINYNIYIFIAIIGIVLCAFSIFKSLKNIKHEA